MGVSRLLEGDKGKETGGTEHKRRSLSVAWGQEVGGGGGGEGGWGSSDQPWEESCCLAVWMELKWEPGSPSELGHSWFSLKDYQLLSMYSSRLQEAKRAILW